MFLRFADDPNPSSMSEQQVEQAEADLLNAEKLKKDNRYWPRIREKLLSVSSAKDVDEAVKEWEEAGSWTEENGVCELCGFHPIFYHFRIRNRLNRNSLVVGSECIFNYLQIPGIDADTLKRQLGQQRSKLKAIAEGRASEGDLAKLREVQGLAREVNLLINKVSSPDKDLEVDDLYKEFAPIIGVGRGLGLKSASWTSLVNCGQSLSRLQNYLHNEVGRRSKKYTGSTMLPAVASILNYRSGVDDQLSALKRLKELVEGAFTVAPANGLVKMAMEEIRDGRGDVLNRLNEKLEEAKASCQKLHKEVLDYIKPYEHLHFMIQAGINANKAQMDKMAEETRKVIESDAFIEALKGTSYWQVERKVSPTFEVALTKGESRLEDAAFFTLRFVNAARYSSGLEVLTYAIREAWKLPVSYSLSGPIKDKVGVVKAMLRAADDGLINAEAGEGAIREFADLIKGGNERALALIEEEVDDVKALVKSVKQMKVYEAMAESWKFDVKKFYEAVPYDHPYFPGFCGQMLRSFMNGRMEPTFKERASIDKNLLKYKAPVPNSCWDNMKSTLLKPYTPNYAR